ncbi:MAG TPA: tetraacyldisaccharide 4'-kinase [Aquabacterium sp.]|uniref:tetraacyldisaccharide 4'-kinase n=1 Tax=Aquabacterium sp. TaxID=1872578 RepID=UPI002E2FC121|nr:tetraacyldisaccharide 4'-kinase [Aquabacterium sp.]HEX5374374.1 tetraacyldisaccharide 4'-kinase [Aquabacterium sp.]
MPSSRAADWLTRQWRHIGVAAVLLWPLHLLMLALAWARRLGFQRGCLTSQAVPVPVVVVGNRVVGGAGKTPTVLALIEHLRQQGWTPGVLSRGYGRQQPPDGQRDKAAALILDEHHQSALSARDVGDEPWLIWRRTRAPMAVASRRAVAGRALVAAHPEIDILVCDDGLQHLALARQIEIVVFDERGAGNGLLLPAGPLREPINTAPGPGCTEPALVLYNADRPSTALAGHVAHKLLLPPRPLSLWWSEDRPAPESAAPDIRALRAASAQDCWALAGIAQPERFFQPLRAMGLSFTPCPLPDHDALDPLPWPEGLRHVIMTEKDAVKLSPDRLARQRPGTQVWVAPLAFTPVPGFWQDLDARLAPLRPHTHHPKDTPTPWTPD